MKGDMVVSKEEDRRRLVVEQVVTGKMTLKKASRLLGVSYRQAKRMKRRYKREGLQGLLHHNRGRRAPNEIVPAVRRRVVDLHEEKYGGLNDTHFTEFLKREEGIAVSREWVRQVLREAGKKPKRARRSPRHRSRRPRKEQEGIMVQWDGSPHHWFGPELPPCCLMGAVDDAGGKLVGALFVEAESSVGYLRLLDMISRRHGIPLSVYHDRHSSLVRTDDYWSLEEQLNGCQYPTHVGRVLEELGIQPLPAYSAQAKGRIERLFGVLQDRMIAEMRLDGITDIVAANRWLKAVYIPRYNRQFAKNPLQRGSAFRKIAAKDIHNTICFAYEATVANDNCVRLGGIIIDIPKGKRGKSYARRRVLVKQHLDGSWSVWCNDQKIAVHEATDLREPVRSWKRRETGKASRVKEALQVYIASKPPSPRRGHFAFAVRGT